MSYNTYVLGLRKSLNENYKLDFGIWLVYSIELIFLSVWKKLYYTRLLFGILRRLYNEAFVCEDMT